DSVGDRGMEMAAIFLLIVITTSSVFVAGDLAKRRGRYGRGPPQLSGRLQSLYCCYFRTAPEIQTEALPAAGMTSHVKKTHRFGLLTPSSNTVQEPEFSALLPRTVSLHTARVAYRDITPQEQMRCVLELESESRKLADAEVDVIVFAATAPTLAKGMGYDRELIKRIRH